MLVRLVAAYAASLWAPKVVVLFTVVGLAVVRRRGRIRLGWALVPTLALSALLGCIERQATPPASAAPVTPRRVVVEGWIASRPTQVGSRSVCLFAAGDSLLSLRAAKPLPGYGRHGRAYGELRAAQTPRNFHTYDERLGLSAQGASAVLEVDSLRVLPGECGPSWRRNLTEPLRERVRALLYEVLADRPAALLAALLVGVRDGIAPDVRETWRALGLSHVLAISGMHVGLVAAGLVCLLGAPRRPGTLLGLVGGVYAYAALGGLGPSVLRASGMASWVALAAALGRDRRPLVALGLVSLGLVLAAPEKRHDVGLQLSCLATFGILVWASGLTALALRWSQRGVAGVAAAWGMVAAATSLAAQLATLPLALFQFGYVSGISLPANLVLVPLANAALLVGIVGVPLSFVADTLGRPLLLLAGGLLEATHWLGTAAIAGWEPRLYLPTTVTSISCSVVVAGAGLAAGCLLAAPVARPRRILMLVVLALLAALASAGLCRKQDPAWRLDMLDVGQGDATLLNVAGHAWLIDAGDLQPVDQGSATILPQLRRQGIRRLRGLILSHPHLDHCGGAASVLAAVRVDTLYLASVSQQAEPYRALRDAFPAQPMRNLAAGDRLELAPAYAAFVLWPLTTEPEPGDANAQSLVIWATGPGHPQFLTMGDLEMEGERALVAAWRATLQDVAADFLVLKVGHHGSNTSSTPVLLDLIDAELALISVGRFNRYGHPAAATLDAFRARDCIPLRTDVGGAIRVEQRGRSLWLSRPGGHASRVEPGAL